MANDNALIITLAGTAIALLLSVIHQLLRRRKKEKEAAVEMENQTPKPTPSPTLSSGQSYELFLSFKGEDTHCGFTDHLYTRLRDAGILVFRDDEELRVGETIGPELCKAIKASKISIPIISPNYASSKWCLNELVQMLKCKKKLGRRVLPIFYNVEPSDVRNQEGGFGKAFELYIKKHEFDGKLVQEWKNALTEVSSLKGWESNKVANGHEGKLVKIIVTRVFNELRKAILDVPDLLVGVEDHVKKIMRMMEDGPSNDVKIIGIVGMGGIGKTTLAKALYNLLSDNFEYRSFASNIREASCQYRGMEGLQKQVISDTLMDKSLREISNTDEGLTIIKKSFKEKKLLLLLDDVENMDQLNKLAADPSWFAPKSIIIMTTRNKNVIEGLKSSLHYELNELDFNQSFQLFCKHAFRKDKSPSAELEPIAKDIVLTTGGLPLAIEVIGSLLFQKSKDYWKAILKKLKRIPNDEVLKKLRVSYDALNHEEQQIFLDITCLPIKQKVEYAFYMWNDCDFYPEEGIQVLISLSLIKIGDKNQLIIHDQLRDMGREIVRRDSYRKLGKRSRLGIPEEAIEVIRQKKGTEKVQALYLDSNEEFTDKHFENLTNLRYLKMQKANLVGDFKNTLSELRWLDLEASEHLWDGTSCHLEDLVATIHAKKLVVLDLSWRSLAGHLKYWGQIELARRLKVLNLSRCNITITPDFSALTELEILNLSNCRSLRKIHPSICNLNKTLKTLDVSRCCKLDELPVGVGKMEELREFQLDETCIREIPICEGFMTKLGTLSASNCRELMHVPDSIGSLEMLRSLSLKLCILLTKIPETIGNLKLLTELHLGGTRVTELPDSIGDLHSLKLLDLEYLPIRRLPTSIAMLSDLQVLNLDYCQRLESLPNLPCSLTSLKLHADSMETFPDISYLTNLRDLKYSDAFERRNGALKLRELKQLNTLKIFHSMVHEQFLHDKEGYEELMACSQLVVFEDSNLLLEVNSSLVELQACGCQTLRHLPNMSNWKRLSQLCLMYCSGLTEINGLEGPDESLKVLIIDGCDKLSKISDLGASVKILKLGSCYTLKRSPHLAAAKTLERLILFKCSNLVEIPGLDSIEGLQYLGIHHCSSLEGIGDLSNLKMLRNLHLSGCEKLSVVEGIDKLTSLVYLEFYLNNPNVKFPDLSMLRNLQGLGIGDERLVEIPGLEHLKSLNFLDISGCKSLQFLPESLFTNLISMKADGCENLTQIHGFEKLNFHRPVDNIDFNSKCCQICPGIHSYL